MVQTILFILFGGAIAYLSMYVIMKFKKWELIETAERKQLENDVFLLNEKVIATETRNAELEDYFHKANSIIDSQYEEGGPFNLKETMPASFSERAYSDEADSLSPADTIAPNRVAKYLTLHFAKIKKETSQSSLLSKYTKTGIVTNYNILIDHAIRNIRNGLV